MSNYEKFSLELRSSKNYLESFNAYSNYIEALGLHSMSYAFVPVSPFHHHKQMSPQFSVTDDFSQSFLEEYDEKGFQSHDYIVNEINEGRSNDIYLWENDRKSGRLEHQAARIIDNAKSNHHMGNGCSILTAKSTHGIGAISIIGDETDKSFHQQIKEFSNELHCITEAFHNHVITRSYEVSPFIMHTLFSDLIDTERKVLRCLLDGDSVPQTANKICKSRGYVENLVREIRLKLGGTLPNGKPRISKDRLLHFCGLMRVYDEL